MADQPRQPQENLAQVEVRSIDYIPAQERHGRIRDQFTMWFGLNANIFPVVLGGVLVFMGLDFLWACIAIVAGVVIGLVLVGFHAIQGPMLGVPQMIQSRGQFGFYGAVLVFAASIVLDFGFLAAQLVIQADAMNLLVSSISVPAWIAILAVPVVVLTIYGYDWIHRWQRWMTVILGITFVVVFVQAIGRGAPDRAAGQHPPAVVRAVHGGDRAVRDRHSELGAVRFRLFALPAGDGQQEQDVLGGGPGLRDPADLLCDPRRLHHRAAPACALDGGGRRRDRGQVGTAGDGGEPDRVRRGELLYRNARPGEHRELRQERAALGLDAGDSARCS